jgi:hypothetical protein
MSTPFVYGMIALLLIADTGITPLEFSFWVVFAPFWLAVELALSLMRKHAARRP